MSIGVAKKKTVKHVIACRCAQKSWLSL